MFLASDLRNPLAYPAGRKPGFDRRHPLSNGCLASVIPSGANIVNLLSGAVGTVTGGVGSPAILVDGHLGPAIQPVTGQVPSVSIPIGAHLPVTVACFSIINTSSTAMFCGSTAWRFDNTGGHFRMVANSVTAIDSGITISVGVPYFFAASASSSKSSFVIANLLTGTVSGVAGGGSGTPSSDSGFSNTGIAGTSITGQVVGGPAMFAAAFTSLDQLLQWAQRPWDFWYP